jgi:hypothetical protein
VDFVGSALHMELSFRTNLVSRDNDIEGIVELTFSVDDEKFGERRTIDLIPGGRDIPVTNENKAQYIE